MESFYKPTKNWTIILDKLNYRNNQRVVSGSLEFTDRTINNSRFNIDRDFGLFLDYSHQKPNSFLRFKGSDYQGRQKLGKTEDDGIALTGKWSCFH
jgi:hypothetical protein